MNRNHWIDNCPDCDEVVLQFYLKKAFTPEDSARNGWSGVEGYFCAGCDRLLIALGFDSDDRETFWIARSGAGDFTIPVTPPGRSHSCYISHAIKRAAASHGSSFSALRSIHKEIGPRCQPDDPRLTIAISDSQADISAMVHSLDQWLTNRNCGRVASQEHESGCCVLHLELSEPVGGRCMVDRWLRKFELSNSTKLYAYNEGRRYSIR